MTEDRPSLPVLERYMGKQGENYFDPFRSGEVYARFSLAIFTPYIREQDEVLDFGCGAGWLLEKLPGKRKVGMDANPAAVEFAKARGLEVVKDLEALQSQRFDVIVSNHVLEHVPSPYHLLTKLAALLHPGGRIIFNLPLDDWRSKEQRRWSENDKDMHLYTWTPMLLGNLLSATGFHPRRIEVVTHCWFGRRLTEMVWDADRRLYSLIGWLVSSMRKRRQLFALATKAARSNEVGTRSD